MGRCSVAALLFTLLYHCQECAAREAENSTICNNSSSNCLDSSGPAVLQTALGIGGGSAALGLASVLALLAAMFVCKRRLKRRSSYTPDTGQPEPPRRVTTFRKRSIKASENGTNSASPKLTHNYETVLPNLSKKPPPAKEAAQNYEVPLTKAATLPHDSSHTATDAGKSLTLHNTKFSSSVKVRGSSPEAVYMNVKKTAGSEDVCATNPWNHHHHHQEQWNTAYSQGGPTATATDQVVETEMRHVSPGDPWAV